jgi:hypothetical protein
VFTNFCIFFEGSLNAIYISFTKIFSTIYHLIAPAA